MMSDASRVRKSGEVAHAARGSRSRLPDSVFRLCIRSPAVTPALTAHIHPAAGGTQRRASRQPAGILVRISLDDEERLIEDMVMCAVVVGCAGFICI